MPSWSEIVQVVCPGDDCDETLEVKVGVEHTYARGPSYYSGGEPEEWEYEILSHPDECAQCGMALDQEIIQPLIDTAWAAGVFPTGPERE